MSSYWLSSFVSYLLIHVTGLNSHYKIILDHIPNTSINPLQMREIQVLREKWLALVFFKWLLAEVGPEPTAAASVYQPCSKISGRKFLHFHGPRISPATIPLSSRSFLLACKCVQYSSSCKAKQKQKPFPSIHC